jgi:hypothetical protein
MNCSYENTDNEYLFEQENSYKQIITRGIIQYLFLFNYSPNMFWHIDVFLRSIHLINTLIKLTQGYFTRLYLEFNTCKKFYQCIYQTNIPDDGIWQSKHDR